MFTTLRMIRASTLLFSVCAHGVVFGSLYVFSVGSGINSEIVYQVSLAEFAPMPNLQSSIENQADEITPLAETSPEASPEAIADTVPEPEPIIEPEPIPEPEPIVEPEPSTKPEPEPIKEEIKQISPKKEEAPESTPEPKPEPKPQPKPEPKPDPKPQNTKQESTQNTKQESTQNTSTQTSTQNASDNANTGTGEVNPFAPRNIGGMMSYDTKQVDTLPSIVKSATPKYPQKAQRMNIQGKVIIQLIVDTSGNPKSCTVIHAEPTGYFEESALEAAQKMRFKPGQIKGKNVNTLVHIPIVFNVR